MTVDIFRAFIAYHRAIERIIDENKLCYEGMDYIYSVLSDEMTEAMGADEYISLFNLMGYPSLPKECEYNPEKQDFDNGYCFDWLTETVRKAVKKEISIQEAYQDLMTECAFVKEYGYKETIRVRTPRKE